MDPGQNTERTIPSYGRLEEGGFIPCHTFKTRIPRVDGDSLSANRWERISDGEVSPVSHRGHARRSALLSLIGGRFRLSATHVTAR